MDGVPLSSLSSHLPHHKLHGPEPLPAEQTSLRLADEESLARPAAAALLDEQQLPLRSPLAPPPRSSPAAPPLFLS